MTTLSPTDIIALWNEQLKVCESDPFLFFGNKKADVLIYAKRSIHPDKFVADPALVEQSKNIFSRLTYLYETLTESKTIGPYRVVYEVAKGDLCDVFKVAEGDQYYILKQPRIAKQKVTEKEFNTIKLIADCGKVYAKLVPEPVRFTKEFSLYKWADGLITGSEVIIDHKDLDSRHIVWMFKRALLIIGYLHTQGLVHGAVTPDHLIFDSINHGLVLTGFIHSGKINDSIEIVPKKWIHYYPSETRVDKKLTMSLDIYMLAKSMIDIGGKNLHPKLRAFLDTCVIDVRMRPSDAWVLHDEVSDLAKRLYGKPQFLSF